MSWIRSLALVFVASAVACLVTACGAEPKGDTPTAGGGTDSTIAKGTIEVVAEVSNTRPGNITVTPDGRVIVTQHPLDAPALRVVEILEDGSTKPFPNEDWADGPEKGDVGIASTIGIAADTKGNVWVLDMGSEASKPQLVAWNAETGKLHKRLEIPASAVTPISFLQDFALDEKRSKVYIADMTFPPPGGTSKAAIVVLDLETGSARRVLEGAKALMPTKRDVVIEGSLVGTKLEDGTSAPHHLGINPIAIDPAFAWVYFGTIGGDAIYRIPAKALADEDAKDAALEMAIVKYGEKRPCDGIAVDGKGRVYITDIEGSAVGVTTEEGYTVLAHDKKLLSWPDGFALGPDGWLYVVQNNLHAHPALNEGEDASVKPYHILRVKRD